MWNLPLTRHAASITPRTFWKNCRTQPQDDIVWPHISLEKWQRRGCPKVEEYLQKFTLQTMENMRAPEDHDELIEKGERFIGKLTSARKSWSLAN